LIEAVSLSKKEEIMEDWLTAMRVINLCDELAKQMYLIDQLEYKEATSCETLFNSLLDNITC